MSIKKYNLNSLDSFNNNFVLINDKYLGKIVKSIWNDNALICKLDNEPNFVDNALKQYGIMNGGGMMLLNDSDKIRYVNPNNLHQFITNNKFSNLSKIYSKILLGGNFINNTNNLTNNVTNDVTNDNTNNVTNKDINNIETNIWDTSESEKNTNKNSNNSSKDILNEYQNYSKYLFKKKLQFNQKFSIKETDLNLEPGTFNKIIKPAFLENLQKFYPVSTNDEDSLENHLSFKHKITDNKDYQLYGEYFIKKIFNKLDNITSSIKDNNGNSILDILKNEKGTMSINPIFGFIVPNINGEYIEFVDSTKRKFSRTISKTKIPNLSLLKQNYDSPIDHISLSKIVFQNKNDLQNNKNIIQESLDIASQENVICLQPKVNYVFWTIIRLFVCWFSDDELRQNIFQINLLINLYNSNNDILQDNTIKTYPIITIITNYGDDVVKKIISKLSFYFSPYKNEIAFKTSSPSLFKKHDELIYFSNGSISIKKFIKLNL